MQIVVQLRMRSSKENLLVIIFINVFGFVIKLTLKLRNVRSKSQIRRLQRCGFSATARSQTCFLANDMERV